METPDKKNQEDRSNGMESVRSLPGVPGCGSPKPSPSHGCHRRFNLLSELEAEGEGSRGEL